MTFKRKMHKALSVFVLLSFVSGQILPSPSALAQTASILNLPLPGAMVGISPKYVPIAIKGIKVFPDNPFRFDFLLDTGDSKLSPERLNEETKLLIRYFLTALTIPDDDQWVNLSPYENDRIVPNEFGITEMGRDLLAQDYLLKQLTASLVYPEHELGKRFWERVYKKAYEKYGDVDIPVSTFNKVWIMPDHATVYQHGNTAVIAESHLKVMLEEDYLAFLKSRTKSPDEVVPVETTKDNAFGAEIVREIVLPEIEKEVNEGKNFAKLRQIYHSMIVASWFKRKLKEGILVKLYVGTNKVAGVDVADKEIKQKIYDQYLVAFKKGVYNYIREDVNAKTQEIIPRKYFSGGVVAGIEVDKTTEIIPVTSQQLTSAAGDVVGDSLTAAVGLDPLKDGKSIGSNESTQEKPNGGALKDLSVFDPDKPATEPTTAVLVQWKIQASTASVQTLTVAGQAIRTKILEVDVQEMSGMTAYHFVEPDKTLVIVIASNIKEGEVRSEVVFHEAMEANWSELLMAEAAQPLSTEELSKLKRNVHILAWAQQVTVFGKENLTPLHQQQLALLSDGQREALKAEKTRAYQDELVRQYFPLDRYEEYLKYKQKFQDAINGSFLTSPNISSSIPKIGDILTEEFLQALARLNQLNVESLKRMLPVGKEVTADYLEGVGMLGRLLNLEEGLKFGVRGGVLANGDREIYDALFEMSRDTPMNLSADDQERVIATLARMREGSLQLLNVTGVLTDLEFDLLRTKDEKGLRNLNTEEKRELLNRLAELVKSYNGLAKTSKTGLMIRLVPLKVVDHLMKYFGSSRANILTIIRGHPDFPVWLPSAERKVLAIQDTVSGPRNAWIVVQAQGIDKTDEWVEKAQEVVSKIQPLVGSRGQAWHIMIIQGIAKADEWVTKAHVKVLAIQDKVGGSSNAWQIVVRQGIDKVDDWVEKAQKKVAAILPTVGSETNAWLILIGLGTDKVDAWIESRKEQAAELQRSGQLLKTAWRNIIRTSLLSGEDNGVALKDVDTRPMDEDAGVGNQAASGSAMAAPLNGKPQTVIPAGESPQLLLKRKYIWETMSRMKLASGEIITVLEHDNTRYGGEKPFSQQRPSSIVFPGDYFLLGLDYVQNEFRLMLPFVNSQEYVDEQSGETFTIKSEFYPETGFTYHEIFRKDGTEAGQFTDPRMGNASQDPAAAILRRYDRVVAARAGKGEKDLVGAVKMDYRRVMTREEIDLRIDEIPKESRKWLLFGGPENDGEVPLKFRIGEAESEWFALQNVAGFTIGKMGSSDAFYVAVTSDEKSEIFAYWIKYDSSGPGGLRPVLDSKLIDKKDLPLSVLKEFNIELDEDIRWAAAKTLMVGPSLQAGFGMGYYERMEDEIILIISLIGEPDTVPYFELGNWPEDRIELRKDFTVVREEIWSVKWGQFMKSLIDNDLEVAKRVLDEARNGPIKAPLGHDVNEMESALTDPIIKEKLIRMFEQQQNAEDFEFSDSEEEQERIDTPFYSSEMLKKDLEILGLNEGATREDLNKAKRKLNSQYYPDRIRKQGEDLLEAGRKLQEINDAYARLKKHPWFSDKDQNNPEEEVRAGDQAADGENSNRLPGGALKQIGILDEDQLAEVFPATIDRWKVLADKVELQQREIAGQTITAKIITSETNNANNGRMPEGLFAYHFRDALGNLVIVLSPSLGQEEGIRNEASYHEFREDYWQASGRDNWEAHVLASAEESIAFGQNGTKISPYHQKQIENLSGQQRGQMIEEDREQNHMVILDGLGPDKFDEYVRYENMIQAELKRIDVEVLRRDRSNEPFTLELPAARFGAAVDLGRLLEEAGVETLGYVPLFSIFGSYTYIRTPDGFVDWDHISDLDIRIHARKSLSFQQYMDFKVKLFEKLRQEKGLVVVSPDIDNPQKRGSTHLYWSIQDIKTNNSLHFNIQMGNLDDVFEGKGSFMSYRVTDQFFGDLSELKALTDNLSERDFLQTTIEFYRESLQELKSVIGEPYTSKYVLGKLKTFYQLAVMRGKGEEYRWLIDEVDRFSDQLKRNAFDSVDFGRVTARALQGLDVNQEDVLISDLSGVFRAGPFGVMTKAPLDEVPAELLEMPLFGSGISYVAYDESSGLEQSEERGAMLERIAARAQNAMIGFLAATKVPTVPGGKEFLLGMVEDVFENGADAILQRLDGMEPSRRDQAANQAKLVYSYRENSDANEFEIVLSDTGTGINGDILNDWKEDNFGSTKPEQRDNEDGEFKGPYFGQAGFAINLNLSEAQDLGYTITIISKSQEDGVTRKFVQTPDGNRTVIPLSEGRLEVGTDVMITGEMIGGTSAGKAALTPAQGIGNKTPGGIDMNQKALNLQTEGSEIKFDMPFDPAQWESIKFDGFTPVILQINTTNLPIFIGAQDVDKPVQLSSV